LKNREIYDAALRVLAEKCVDGANDDYEERAPYLIANFCCESSRTDTAYRKAHSLGAAKKVSSVFLDLDTEFPCCERFTTAAIMYLAAMLIIDENTELSDKFFDMYSDAMSEICMEIPAVVERIIDRYEF